MKPDDEMVDTNPLTIELGQHAARILDDLSDLGVYGVGRAEIVQRFLDERLQEFVTKPTYSFAAVRVREKPGPKKQRCKYKR